MFVSFLSFNLVTSRYQTIWFICYHSIYIIEMVFTYTQYHTDIVEGSLTTESIESTAASFIYSPDESKYDIFAYFVSKYMLAKMSTLLGFNRHWVLNMYAM